MFTISFCDFIMRPAYNNRNWPQKKNKTHSETSESSSTNKRIFTASPYTIMIIYLNAHFQSENFCVCELHLFASNILWIAYTCDEDELQISKIHTLILYLRIAEQMEMLDEMSSFIFKWIKFYQKENWFLWIKIEYICPLNYS